MGLIRDNAAAILAGIPRGVTVLAAAKSRDASEITEVIDAGITDIGENYFQESRTVIEAIGGRAMWHFIGHIQKNKVKHIVPLFDMIQTVDTFDLAAMIDQHAAKHGKVMPVLVEVNSGLEEAKHGAMPESVADLVRRIAVLQNIRVKGLMTMGPFLDDFQGLRPYFRETRKLFDEVGSIGIPDVSMEILSMGMSDSFRIAIEEGATMVRIGTKIFGERPY
ncbi:MAG TPA: YggS family pyridoxal phosphate-dependent enzyme [Deltaproteobacteria bacterium]|nr:YggS family pyridoxal phosphate-dependent enzyme [Deltaproteobacteria bacterium]HPR54211.1 YggS family pyridoxal phosphate-dependent enzyme [Deltaproteobacteria bacterium]HXK45878.1 YggS family pyridoxal phosphate-dependent enzyme [Deltaproteobacteria bacterium]